MLDDAVAAYLDSVSERAFDEPLVALLRAQRYSDVHLVHGAREFGKDVIARRNGEQWGLQSKAGNIGQPEWRGLVGQLDELRLVDLGHGSYDTSLPRRPVLVTTGRLTGNAPELYRDYNQRAQQRSEPELLLWDRDELLGRLAGNPDAVLRGSLDGQLLVAVGSADQGTSTMSSIEVFSRRWTAWEPQRLAGLGVIEAALLAEHLKQVGRVDLACHAALCLVAGALAASASASAQGQLAAAAAGDLFEAYALELWDRCGDRLLQRFDLAGLSGPSSWITYQVRCTRIGELVGLLALRLRLAGDSRADEIADWLVRFQSAQPGLAHPISDQYAVSVIPAFLALLAVDRGAAQALIEQTTVWLCDRHERGELGLAGPDASPTEETEYLLGSAFDSIEHKPRRSSLIASALLDLCAAADLATPYADVYNDIAAVRLFPWVVRLAEGPDQYLRAGLANRLDPNADFAENLTSGSKPLAPHHRDSAGHELSDAGRAWDLLAASSALRDRWFWPALRALTASAS